MKRLEKEWLKMWAMIEPHGAHETQRIETRRAFYAGAHTMLSLLTENVSEGDDLIEKLDEEIGAFFAEVKAGRA